MKKFLVSFGVACLLSLLPMQAHAYKYSHIDGEFSIDLPDAPTGETIWGSDPDVPYVEKHARYGAIGERATLVRTDIESGDSYEVKISFIKVEPDVARNMTEDDLKADLVDEYKDNIIENVKYNFAKDKVGVKWAVISGSKVDKSNVLLQYATYYLVGMQSVTVISVKYSAENKRFEDYFNRMKKSITYIGK